MYRYKIRLSCCTFSTFNFLNDSFFFWFTPCHASCSRKHKHITEGEWVLVLQQQRHTSQRSPRPMVERRLCDTSDNYNNNKNSWLSVSNFDRATSLITGRSRFWNNWGTATFELRYKTNPSQLFSTRRGSSVVLRRISCTIVQHQMKLLCGGVVSIRIPFKWSRKQRRGYIGFLDFIYMDEDIRVTTNEQGDLFIHARPESIQRLFCD